MLDALSFALFGKSHRKISKPQLVNSINGKGTVVEIEFSIGQSNYKIVRGIKPGIFEIWVNGKMIDQSSHAKEYQQVLEKNILKLNHKSFHQIVVLGSSSFVPFMQLTTYQRRDVIEDLLDINVFSKMNTILKEQVSLLKAATLDNAHMIDVAQTKLTSQKKYIRDLTAITLASRKSKEDEIESLVVEINDLTEINQQLQASISLVLPEYQSELQKLTDKRTVFNNYDHTFKSQIKTIVKEAKFFDDNDHCPTCDQGIADDLRHSKKTAAQSKAKELNDAMQKAAESLASIEVKIAEVTSKLHKVQSDQTSMFSNTKSITMLQQQVLRLQNDITSLGDTSHDMSSANSELESMSNELEELLEQKYVLNEQNSYNQVAVELLKDTGIKTKIIKQYIPVINTLTNQYLQILDFFVHFDLDENFNETIRSRHRDSFTYDSFSEGEKQRIDLSLLFTWRQVAKMKNSVATNLLILDETFDSSLDDDGVDNLMKIIYSLGEDTNVFVISHKAELEDAHFDNKLVFLKEKNFSKLKKVA